ncbi:MAG TPA: hypothetical protein VFI55_15220, partial [Mycobacterium sp.]|nr:hypothetical protein [Mycobacterium sp.]
PISDKRMVGATGGANARFRNHRAREHISEIPRGWVALPSNSRQPTETPPKFEVASQPRQNNAITLSTKG